MKKCTRHHATEWKSTLDFATTECSRTSAKACCMCCIASDDAKTEDESHDPSNPGP